MVVGDGWRGESDVCGSGRIGHLGDWGGIGELGNRCGVRDLGYGGGVCDLGNWGDVRNLGDRSVGDFGDLGGFSGVSLVADDRVESVLLVSGVLYDAVNAIRLNQGVRAVDGVSGAGLLLRLDVAGVVVFHGVLEFVVGGRLGLVRHFGDWHQWDGGGGDGQREDSDEL